MNRNLFLMMNTGLRFKTLLAAVALALCLSVQADAQNQNYDVFVPISKYITQGDAESLSAWFAKCLDIGILSEERNCSRKQAKEITKVFFKEFTPSSFNITHTAGKSGSRYVIGELNAGGERFTVSIFVCSKCGEYRIEQFNVTKAR